MEAHPDVLILGGGVIGLSTAYFLAREGVRVEIVDKGEFGQESSWAGAGILPPASLPHAKTPFEKLRARSIALYPSLSAELRERTGLDNGYLRSGGLEFTQGVEHEDEWRGAGVVCERVEPQRLRELEPAANPAIGPAYFLPDMAQLRNPRHVQALLTACASLGVKLHPGCPVHALERQGQHIVAAQSARGALRAGRFLIAAGAWSDNLLAPLGFTVGIHPVRGQIVLLRTVAPVLHCILLHGPRYLVPRADGLVLIGSTEEHAGFDKHTTAEAVQSLLALANRLAPALSTAHLERAWAGLRPGSPDGLPYLGPIPGIDNAFVAAGHYRAGLLLSPGTALVLSELLRGLPSSVPLDAFRLDRPTVRA